MAGNLEFTAHATAGDVRDLHTTVTIIPVGAARIAAESAGEGPPVVFVHANVADRRMWRHQLAALASTYRVIAFDRRGFGETPASNEPYSQTDDLFAVVDHLVGPGKPVALVGCSKGGGIAVDAALAAPERVAALVLIAPGVSGAAPATPVEAVQRLLDAIDAADRSGDLDQVNRLKAALWLDGPLANEGRVKGPARELFLTMNAIALAAPRPDRVREPAPAWERLERITVPVRILCGDLDVPHIQTRCRQLAAALPNARLDMLHDVAHLPSLEEPEQTTAKLTTLLADCRPA